MTPGNARPIVIRRIRKAAHVHHGGAWKVAYADFVTAMMAFFMLLWLISDPDKSRLKGLAEYFSPSAPGHGAPADGDSPGDSVGLGAPIRQSAPRAPDQAAQPTIQTASSGSTRGGTANVPDAAMRVMAQELRVAIDSDATPGADQNVKIEPTRAGLRINLMDSAKRSMFRGGTAQLNDYARQILQHIAAKLAKSGGQFAIEGHTDSVGGQSSANWRLSGERALAARDAMVAGGITPDRFNEVVAMAGAQPVYPDQPDRPENRRITVVVLGAAPASPSDPSFKF